MSACRKVITRSCCSDIDRGALRLSNLGATENQEDRREAYDPPVD